MAETKAVKWLTFSVKWGSIVSLCNCPRVSSVVPRPSLAPFFDRLQYAKTEGQGLGESCHTICGAHLLCVSGTLSCLVMGWEFETRDHAMTGKGTPPKTSVVFEHISQKAITCFAITAPPIQAVNAPSI